PAFEMGGDQSVLEDSGPQTITAWARDIAPGPANELTQTLSFLVSNSNPGLFSLQPLITPQGALTYQPAPDANGTAVVTVVLKDSGGTANGGQDSSAPQAF